MRVIPVEKWRKRRERRFSRGVIGNPHDASAGDRRVAERLRGSNQIGCQDRVDSKLTNTFRMTWLRQKWKLCGMLRNNLLQ